MSTRVTRHISLSIAHRFKKQPEGHRGKDGKLQLKVVTSSESSEISIAVGMFLWDLIRVSNQ